MMKQNNRRKLLSFLEAFVSPIAGLAIQLVLYLFMGVDMKDVSIVFIIVFWVIISAMTAMVFERMEPKKG